MGWVFMATLARVGRMSDTQQHYGALAHWVEQNGWPIAGSARNLDETAMAKQRR